MLNKKSLISVLVMFVISMLTGFISHALLLGPDYAALPLLFRTPEAQEAMFPFMLLGHVFMALGFVWIYLRGKEDKPYLAQGIRFGIAIAVIVAFPMYLIFYAVQPMPGLVVVKQILFDTIGYIVMGVILAALHK